MKIFIVCSRMFYTHLPPVEIFLMKAGHEIILPNHYDNPGLENSLRGTAQHVEFKRAALRASITKVAESDAILVVNLQKSGVPNYIGGSTFLEMWEAFRQNKPIFIFNEIPEGLLQDEIVGMQPIILHGDLQNLKSYA